MVRDSTTEFFSSTYFKHFFSQQLLSLFLPAAKPTGHRTVRVVVVVVVVVGGGLL